MSKTIPVRLSLAQIRHLRTLVEKSAVAGSYWGERQDWERRTTWLHRALLDAERRLRGRMEKRGGHLGPPEDEEGH